MPCLDFSIQDFPTSPKFVQFVTRVLSQRSNLAQVFSIKLRFCGDFNRHYVKQILKYAFSHNIQQLDVKCFLENDIEFPLSVFSSRSLKHLHLSQGVLSSLPGFIITTSTWELPALTTLYLGDITLTLTDDDTDHKCISLFSKCVNLQKLSLVNCRINGSHDLSIRLPRLSSLTLVTDYESWKSFNVVAPQLKILNIGNWSWEIYQISAPELTTLNYSGSHPLLLSTDGFHSMETLDLFVSSPKDADAPIIFHLFQQFKSVKFLSLNLEILEILASSLEIIPHEPSPFTNVKSLNIYPVRELPDDKEEAPEKVNLSIEVKNYLLNNSPNSTFTMVLREEIRDMKNTKMAQELMGRFRDLLEYEKSTFETKRAHVERKKEPMESQDTKRHDYWDRKLENLLMIQERTNQINKCWNDISVQIKEKKQKTLDIISSLQDIKDVLTTLPTSKRSELQECFSSLCAEADTFLNKIVDQLKMQCDTKRNRFSGYIHELASTSE